MKLATHRKLLAHATVKTCLSKISRCDVTAVGVLADYLEEHGLPFATTVRQAWVKYTQACEWTDQADFSRRSNTKWENIALWRRWLRRRIATLFGRKWKSRPIEAFK